MRERAGMTGDQWTLGHLRHVKTVLTVSTLGSLPVSCQLSQVASHWPGSLLDRQPSDWFVSVIFGILIPHLPPDFQRSLRKI